MTDTKAADRQTLSEYLTSVWKGSQEYDGLEAVVSAIADGGEQVHQKVQQAALGDVLGGTGEINVHGEMVQRLDRDGTDIFVDSLRRSGRVAAIGGEEQEVPVIYGEDADYAYTVVMDPLDGSSNIDVAVSIGSIFGIWPRRSGVPVTESSMLRPGNEQVAAAYVIYGSSTVMVIATRQGVDGFTLDPASGTFALTHPSMKFPEKCEYYSINEGNFGRLDPATQQAVISLRDAYSLRYVGSLVADFHRNLLKGGIFLYPGDSKSPDGKLRLMYEANPLGFIAVQAGGAASSGRRSILEVEPQALHQRTPLILGNRDVVEKTVATMSRE